MAVYQYYCTECKKTEEVMKPISEIDRVERCSICGTSMKRLLCESNFKINGYSEQNGYNSPSNSRR